MNTWHVKLTYFKETGKYYSSGALEVEAETYSDVVTHLKQLHQHGRLPGLTSGGKDFHMVADIGDGHPVCFVPHLLLK